MGGEGERRTGSSASGRRGVGERVSFARFLGRNRGKGTNWGKIYVLLLRWDGEGGVFCVLERKMANIFDLEVSNPVLGLCL